MKILPVIGVIVTIIVLFIAFFGFTRGDDSKVEEPWNPSSPDNYVDGTWGTSLEVEYIDGVTETLNDAPLVDITFRSSKVKEFRYILYSKISSETYNAIEIDMSNFDVLTLIKSQGDTKFGVKTETEILNIDADGTWYEVYRVVVSATELESLEAGYSYNLSFTPSGSIGYRGSSTGTWTDVTLPDWFYLTFSVNAEDPDDPDDPDGDKWIEIELSSETEN